MPISTFPIISQWKLLVAIGTRGLNRLEQQQKKNTHTHTQLFVPPAYRCCIRNLARIGFMASEELLFENVDDDGCLPIL